MLTENEFQNRMHSFIIDLENNRPDLALLFVNHLNLGSSEKLFMMDIDETEETKGKNDEMMNFMKEWEKNNPL